MQSGSCAGPPFTRPEQTFQGDAAPFRDPERERERRLPRAPLDHGEVRNRTADIGRHLRDGVAVLAEVTMQIRVDAPEHEAILAEREGLSSGVGKVFCVPVSHSPAWT